MTTIKKSIALTAVLLMSVSLSACIAEDPSTPTPGTASPSEPADDTLVVTPGEPEGMIDLGADGYKATVVDGKIVFDNGGSSSCPPLVAEAKRVEDTLVTLRIADYTDKMCTADFRPYQQIISTTDGTPLPEDTEVKVIYPVPRVG